MRAFNAFTLSFVLLTSFACKTTPQAAPELDNSPERKQRVLANLTHEFPDLGSLSPEIGNFKRVALGMDEVELNISTPEGSRTQRILLTPDDKALYLVVGEPIDASRSVADLNAAKATKRADLDKHIAEAVKGRPFKGPETASITIVEFSDFQCPYCKVGHDSLSQASGRFSDRVRVVFMPFPLSFHRWAQPASLLAECAQQQSDAAFWTLYDGFFAKQESMTEENVLEQGLALLADAKIDVDLLKRCSQDPESPEHKRASATIAASMEAGRTLGVEGTPAYFINGEMLGGALPAEMFVKMIEEALQSQK